MQVPFNTKKYPHLEFKIKQKSHYLVITTTVKHTYNIMKCQGGAFLLRYKCNLLYPSSLHRVLKSQGIKNGFAVSNNSL